MRFYDYGLYLTMRRFIAKLQVKLHKYVLRLEWKQVL